jgi:MFS family permease
LLAATGTSSFGDGMVLVALPLLAVTLTNRPLLIAGVVVAGRLPWLLISLPAGALADRVDRRRLVVVIEVVRAAVLLGLGTLILAGYSSLIAIYLAAFIVGALETAFGAATRATIPALVDEGEVPRANGYLYAADTAGEQFGGAALGGWLFAWAPALPFLGDALSFAGSGALLARAIPQGAPARPSPPTTVRQDVADGWRWFRANDSLPTLALVVTTFAFCQSAVMSVFVLYGLHVLHLSKAGYGLFLAIGGAGDVGGSLVAHRVTGRIGPARAIFVAGVTAAAGYLLLAATSNTAVAFVAYSLEAVAVALGNVTTLSIRHRIIPSELFGRVNNTFRMCVFGVVPLGALTGGLLAAGLGLHTTFLAAGALQVAVIAVLARRLGRVALS